MKLLVFAIALSASAQTMIESGILTGAMGTAAGKAGQTTGKALGMAMGGAAKALGSAAAPPASAKTVPASTASAAAKKDEPAPVPVPFGDVQKVKAGMSRDEVIALLGKPSQKMTIPDGEHITERYRYTADKGWARIALEDGKVTDVETGEKN
jgi:Rieske Fe-S protein